MAKNYGKVLVPIGAIFLIPGVILLSMSNNAAKTIGAIILVFSLLFIIPGLPRLVQGKDPKIFGRIRRPRAAARSSAIWAFYLFLVTPFYIPGTEILKYGPPQIIFTFFSGIWYQIEGYMWVPGTFIGFFIVLIVGFLLSKRHPKVIHILFLAIITTCMIFWLNFGIQLWIWTWLQNTSEAFLLQDMFSSFDNPAQFYDQYFYFSIGFSTAVLLFSVILIIALIKQLKIAFSNLEVQGLKRAMAFAVVLLTYVATMAPMYFGVQLSLENNTFQYQYVNYVGLIIIAGIVVMVITNIIDTVKQFSRERTGEGKNVRTTGFTVTTAVFLVIFLISWAPFFLPIVDGGKNSKFNSAYNENWSGWSSFRETLEEDEGYQVMSVQSSLSTLSQLDQTKHIILMVNGPNIFYNPATEIPYLLTAFKSNFSLFVAADGGTAENLLLSSFVASGAKTPITFIPDGILRDNESYWKNPAFPVIRNWDSGDPITAGINEVVISYGSGFLGGGLMLDLGWNIIGTTSGLYSFIDIDNNGMYDPVIDNYGLPSSVAGLAQDSDNEIAQIAGEILALGVPLGGYEQGVFATSEVAPIGSTRPAEGNSTATYASRVFCATDASWLNNELINLPQFDNLDLGLQAIEYLACGRAPQDVIIVFDEAHIRAESGLTPLTSATTFGQVQAYVNWMSTNPLLGLVYPLFGVQSLRKWIPKEGKKKELQLKDLEEAERNQALLKFRTSSFFAQKINWYRKNKKYRLALIQLYRRLERKTNRMLGDAAQRDLNAIMNAIRRERGNFINKDALRRLESFFDKMLAIKANKRGVRDEDEFEALFMEMSWANDILGSR